MTFTVEFRKSGMILDWTSVESLLELAEEKGINIESACRQGFCGTCKTRLLSGK